MIIRSITFALMSKQSAFDYKILASYLLPKGILEFFDVTAVNEDHTGIIEETGNERVLLHIYLDEKDAREEERHDLMVSRKAVRLTTFLSVITRSFFMSDVADG